MNTRDLSFYSLLGGESGIRAIIDTVNSKYNNTNWKSHFNWDIPQMGLTFNVLTAKSNIAPMASVIDVNSPKPLRAKQGFGGYGGAIPKLGHGFDNEEQTLRDQQLLAANGGSYSISAIAELLYNDVDQLVQGAHSRINYMDDQIRSTGFLRINVDNNPDGIVLDVDYRVPSENFLKAGFGKAPKKAWSDPTANPVQDLIDMAKYADDNNIAYDVFEMSKVLWNEFLYHPSVISWTRARMGLASSAPTYPIGETDVRNAVAGFGGIPPIIINDTKYNAQVDGEDTFIKAFNEGNVVLRPSGLLGKVKNAISMHTLAPSTADNLRSTVEGGRIAILNQWDARKLINHIELEGYAIPTLDNPKNLLILDTTEAASTPTT